VIFLPLELNDEEAAIWQALLKKHSFEGLRDMIKPTRKNLDHTAALEWAREQIETKGCYLIKELKEQPSLKELKNRGGQVDKVTRDIRNKLNASGFELKKVPGGYGINKEPFELMLLKLEDGEKHDTATLFKEFGLPTIETMDRLSDMDGYKSENDYTWKVKKNE